MLREALWLISFWCFNIWQNNLGRLIILVIVLTNNSESAKAIGVPRLNYPSSLCLKKLNRRSKAALDVSDLIF